MRAVEPAELERAGRAILLGLALGLVLAILAERSRRTGRPGRPGAAGGSGR